MKIVALGGCGEMGRRAARIVAKLPQVSAIVIADLDEKSAKNLAKQIGPVASGVGVDVSDSASLRRVLKDADIVTNTVGPFYKYGAKVLSAAIDTKTHYFDINDDWEPTLEMLEYDEAARKADVTAVVGMGGSPGMSNMLALAAMRELDSVHTLYSCFHWDGTDIDPSDFDRESDFVARVNAACLHGIQQMTGTVKVRQGGKFVDIPAWTRIDFDDLGIGATWGRVLGHPEPITFAKNFPEIQESACLTMVRKEDDEACLSLIRGVQSGALTQEQAAALLEKNLVERSPPDISVPGDPKQNLPPMIVAFAKGKKDGQDLSVAFRMNALPGPGMGNLTGIPMSVGVSLLLEGKITRRGAFAPEAGIAPRDFFDSLCSRLVVDDGQGGAQAAWTQRSYKGYDDLIIIDRKRA
ncbi:MAG: saccharopine dehydrogenase NADP-binding domain-containing protein [Hyphomonadaceae bacterium]|nr:saccharopine dehydrogenase NADP-binding domain-containing protein [Hyphomonadaceae bacterium]